MSIIVWKKGLENAGLCRTQCKISMNSIDGGDWLAVIYDDLGWLAKAINVDRQHQDVRLEFMHPCGCNSLDKAYCKYVQCMLLKTLGMQVTRKLRFQLT